MSALVDISKPNHKAGIANDGRDHQFLTFFLGNEEYGVDILRVQEIRGWSGATPIPDTPDYIRGVINLRGVIVPIIDLQRRFNNRPIADSGTTVVIVVKMLSGSGEKTVGVLVDAVSDVRKASDAELQPAPRLEITERGYVKGLALLGEDLIILLDIDRLLDFATPIEMPAVV